MDTINKNKKVAFFITSLRAGGGEKMMVQLAGAFADKGYEVDLVVMKNEGALSSELNPKIHLVDLKVGRIIFSVSKLKRYLKDQKPFAIMATDEYSHLASLIATRFSKVPVKVILRIGNMYSELFRRYKRFSDKYVITFLIKRLYKKADAMIAVSKGVAEEITTLTGIDPKKVHMVYNPKDITEIETRGREEAGYAWFDKKTLPIILTTGRLREQKNFAFLIRAFQKVEKEIPSRLVIVGAGREEKRLLDLIAELNLGQTVSLLGYTPNPYKYMAKADVFVSASLWEGMPNSLIEAIASGLPVVASDCKSGPREIIAPKTPFNKLIQKGNEESEFGILCALNDEKAFVQSIKKILSDETYRNQLRAQSLIRAKDFNLSKGVERYEQAMGLVEIK